MWMSCRKVISQKQAEGYGNKYAVIRSVKEIIDVMKWYMEWFNTHDFNALIQIYW